MELIEIYECFCDRTRLRILHLLQRGPLCVCHLQEVLGEEQAKISKHLSYLKGHHMVEVRKEANWRIYSLVAKPSPTLVTNLACLQDCVREDKTFRRDEEKLRQLGDLTGPLARCCRPESKREKKLRSRK